MQTSKKIKIKIKQSTTSIYNRKEEQSVSITKNKRFIFFNYMIDRVAVFVPFYDKTKEISTKTQQKLFNKK
jgi:hypothetical protein